MSKFEHMTDSGSFDWTSLFNSYIDPKSNTEQIPKPIDSNNYALVQAEFNEFKNEFKLTKDEITLLKDNNKKIDETIGKLDPKIKTISDEIININKNNQVLNEITNRSNDDIKKANIQLNDDSEMTIDSLQKYFKKKWA